MILDVDFHQQVAVGAAVDTYAALTPDADALTLINTRGDADFDLGGLADLALAFTGVAGRADDLATAGAAGTGGGGLHIHAHEILGDADLTGTTALVAVFNSAVGGAGAVADGAVFDALGGDLFLGAESGFLEGQLQVAHHVLAAAGSLVGRGPASAAAEELAENVAQVTEVTETAESAAAIAAGTGAVIGIHAGKAVLVVTGALLLVGQDFISLADLLEHLFGTLVAGVPVGVVLHGLLAVGLFNFLGGGAFVYAKNLVIIAFIFCHMLTS